MKTVNSTHIIIPGYFTITQAAPILGLTKIGAAKAARSEGWKPYLVGNVHLYQGEDVHKYRDHRLRTKLVKALGWRGRGLYRESDIDIECLACGAFAIQWPAPPELATKYMCVEGHTEVYHEDEDDNYNIDTGDDCGTMGSFRNLEDQEIPW